MSTKKHTDTAVDLNIPYEQNEIQLKGIMGFAIGLTLLIVVTFGLMWAFLNVLEDYSKEGVVQNPMQMNEMERLPPEPRLQGAPGFGVDSEKGRVKMELVAPQSEWWELERQYKELWEKGQIDAKTGTVVVMPIKDAKEKLLTQNLKAKSGAEAEKLFKESKMAVTDASAGRMAVDIRR
jgi:hypothetical protein